MDLIDKYLREAKPRGIGSVWEARAKCFDKNGKLLGYCMDTPNAIAKAMMENSKIAYVIEQFGKKKTRSDMKDRMTKWNDAISNFNKK